jgi:hypothetical protein
MSRRNALAAFEGFATPLRMIPGILHYALGAPFPAGAARKKPPGVPLP